MFDLLIKLRNKGLRGVAKAFYSRVVTLYWMLPLTVEIYWWLKDKKERKILGDNNKTFGPIGAQFEGWVRDLEQVTLPTIENGPKVLCFAYQDWLPYSLAMSLVLVGFGCQVDFVWLPYCGWSHDGPFFRRTKYLRVLRYLKKLSHPRLKLIPLLKVPPSKLPDAVLEQIKEQTFLDVQYVAQVEEFDIENNNDDRSAYTVRQQRNSHAAAAFSTLLERKQYNTLLMPSGMVLEYGMAYRLAQRFNIRTVTYESSFQKGTIIASDSAPAIALNTTKEWDWDKPHILSKERRKRILDCLKFREEPSNDNTLKSYQLASKVVPAELYKCLGLSPERPIALLCTNVVGDGAVLDRNILFKSMLDWIRQTIDFFIAHQDCQLIVRAHPGELPMHPRQRIIDVVRASFQELPYNIRLVSPDDVINTYSLMDLSSLGLVYVSTAGIEMAMRGIPVVCAGKAHYGGTGFTIGSETVSQYLDILERWRVNPNKLEITQRQIELAWCYFDMFMFRFSKPFPWQLASFREDILQWPISHVLTETIGSQFKHTWELLLGKPLPRLDK